LFEEKGPDSVTVEEIAEAADVSARTFHRHFPMKEDVLFADFADRLGRLGATLDARPLDEPVLDSVRVATHELASSLLVTGDLERRRVMLMMASDALRSRSLRYTEQWADVIAEHVAGRLGCDPSDALPRLVATSAMAVVRATRSRWMRQPDLHYEGEIDKGFDLLTNLGTAVQTASTTRRRSR
jgi:AcrR family transcriptional regulator